MTGEHDELESQLRDLTSWTGEDPQLWRKALDAAERPRVRIARPLQMSVGWRVGGLAAAAAVVLLVGAAVFLPHLGGSGRASSRSFRVPPSTEYAAAEPGREKMGVAAADSRRSEAERGLVAGDAQRMGAPDPLGRGGPLEPGPADRHVIRKATIGLISDDVRAAFLKTTRLISEATGEYVESASLGGADEEPRAELTLRIAADRLEEVLTQLREFGTVTEEQVTGEDVTDQVVDIEARVRNEERVEQELLELLEKRADAPLKEVLDLRRHIAEVRESIERMTAQRERLGRLVSLASVLVVIRSDGEEPNESAMVYLRDLFGGAWDSGWRFLAGTGAVIISVLVGGAVWWVVLVLVIIGWRARERRVRALGLV